MATAYLCTKLKGSGDIEALIRNVKVFEPECPDPVRPNPVSTKAMLYAEFGVREKRVEKLSINLRMSYGIVIWQCTDYMWSHLEVQEKWKTMANEQDLLGIIKTVKSLLQKYDEDTEYHHVAYHMLLRQFMLLRKGEYSNLECKQRFKEHIEVLEAYHRGVLFRNIPGATVREIAMLGLNA